MSRVSTRDIPVGKVDAAWGKAYNSQDFLGHFTRLLSVAPSDHRQGVEIVLKALDYFAKEGRLKNLNEWIEGISSDALLMPYICEAEYALLLVKNHSNFIVTFEPKHGFYQVKDRDVPIGLTKKSIDLRIHDLKSGLPIALREVKSISGRVSPREVLVDAVSKVLMFPRLDVPDLRQEHPVEIGVVLFFDYDMTVEYADPVRMFNVPSLKEIIKRYIVAVQKERGLLEKPFDTVTIFDFGSRRVIYFKRLEDDSLEITHYPLPSNTFEYFVPKVSILQAKDIEDHSGQGR